MESCNNSISSRQGRLRQSAQCCYEVSETIRRMSQALSTLGDTVGAVINNEGTSNRSLRVITGMSFPSHLVRLQSLRRKMLAPRYLEQMLQ